MADAVPTITQDTANGLLHEGREPFLVAVFYRDGEMQTFATPQSTGIESVPPTPTDKLFKPSFLGSQQLTVTYTEDSATKATVLGTWYYVGTTYKCRAFVSV